MAVDPNVYALQVSLAMDTMQAEQALDQFGESLTSLEDQISSSATKAFGSIQKTLASISDGLSDMSKYATMSIKDMEEELKKLKQRNKLNDTLDDFIDVEKDFQKGAIKHWDETIEKLTRKNELHREENDLLGQEQQLYQRVTQEAERFRDRNRESGDALEKISRGIRRLWYFLLETDKAAENFVTTNWRAYGTQNQLAQEARNLAAQYGILHDEAVKAIVVMGTMKVPRDELTKYSKLVAATSRFTGVGAEALGLYARRMRQVGYDAEALEKHYLRLTELQRKYKLSIEDLGRVMSDTKLSALELEGMFRGEDQAGKYIELRGALAGLAEQAGFSTEEMMQLMNVMEDPEQRMLFEDFTGQAINSVADLANAMDKGMTRAATDIKTLNDQLEAGVIDSKTYQIGLQATAEAAGLTSKSQLFLLAGMRKTTPAIRDEAKAFEEMTAAANEARKSALDPLAESNRTLTRQFVILWSKLYAIGALLLEPLRVALMWFLIALNTVIGVVGAVIEKISEWWKILEGIPVIGQLAKLLRYAAGIIMAVVVGVVLLGGALTGLALTFGGVVGVFRGALLFIRLVGQAIIAMANIVGRVIVIILTSIGQGLAALGQAIQPVMLPLLALGAALMMAGIGAYFFAQGVSVLMQMGWQNAAIGILLMVAAIGLLGLVLVGLGYLAAPVIPIILGLGLAFLMVGAAVWLVGAGMLMMGQALKSVAEYAGLISFGTWVKLAAGIAMLGAAALIAGPGLMMAGVGLMMFAVAARILASALGVALAAIKKFGDETVVKLGKAIRDASVYFLEAAGILALAGIVLAVGAAALVVGGNLMLIAGVVLIIAGLALVISGVMILLGGTMLMLGAAAAAIGGALLFTAGVGVLLGGLMLLPGATMAMLAGIVLIGAAVVLLIAGLALIPAAAVAMAGALALSATGAAMTIGAAALWLGARALSGRASSIADSTNQLAMAGNQMALASVRLGRGIALLRDAVALIKDIPTGHIAGIADDALDFVPKIDKFAAGLKTSAAKLHDSVAAFKKPTDELTMVLQNLGDAIAGVGGLGEGLEDELSGLTSSLNAYIVELEAVAQRIETAVETKALPAVRAAERAGIQEAIKSEAITTVEVIPPEVEDKAQDRMVSLVEEQNGLLRNLVEILAGMGGDDVGKIRDLLESHLNIAATPDSGLSSDLNRWS